MNTKDQVTSPTEQLPNVAQSVEAFNEVPMIPENVFPDDPKLAAFFNKYLVRCKMWAKANGNVKFPIVKDEQGDYHWLNRAQRRKLK